MLRTLLVVSTAALTLAMPPAAASDLIPIELTWLEAAMPVLRFARQQSMPLDIIVQPQAVPGETPVGMAYIEGRCKLVLSMRGNPDAQAMLDRIGPGLLGPVVEAIAAHELAHCWRHLNRTWGTLPAGLVDISKFDRVTPEQAALLQDMWRTRREEGFADLVGLAWTLRHHSARYEEVQAWTARMRADQQIETGAHDTRVWIKLAQDRAAMSPAASIFEQAQGLWVDGLLAGP